MVALLDVLDAGKDLGVVIPHSFFQRTMFPGQIVPASLLTIQQASPGHNPAIAGVDWNDS